MVKYIYCNHCSAKNDSFNEFCTECGQKMDTTTAASHTIVQDNSTRVAISGSYDAMYGTKQEKSGNNQVKNIIISIMALIVFGIVTFVFWYLYNSNTPDSIFP